MITLEEPMQMEGRSRNNAHMRPNLPHDHKFTQDHNETFDPTSRIEIGKNVLVGNV